MFPIAPHASGKLAVILFWCRAHSPSSILSKMQREQLRVKFPTQTSKSTTLGRATCPPAQFCPMQMYLIVSVVWPVNVNKVVLSETEHALVEAVTSQQPQFGGER
jgi:hypothetical protein